MSKQLISILEITDQHIKLLQGKEVRKNKIVTSLDICPIINLSDKEIIRALTDLVSRHGLRTVDLNLILPRRYAIFKQMRLPSQNANELRKMIGLQLISHVPYSLEDVIYDYFVLNTETDGYAQILVIIVHQDIINRYLKIIEGAGLSMSKMGLSSFGISGWVSYQGRKEKLIEHRVVAVVNIDAMHSEICFCMGNKVFFSRSINYGAVDLQESHLVQLITQIELSIKAYNEEKMGPPIGKIIIISSNPKISNIKQRLEKEMNLDLAVFSPLENIDMKKNMKPHAFKDDSGISLTVPLGFLLEDNLPSVKLLPKEVHASQETRKKKLQLIKSVLLLGMVVVLSIVALGLEVPLKEKQLAKIEKKSEGIKTVLTKAKKQIDLAQEIDDVFSKRVIISELLYDLFLLTPDSISYRSIDFDKNGKCILQGYASSRGEINNFQTALVQSQTFQEVNLEFATQRRIFNAEVTDFKITSKLKYKN